MTLADVIPSLRSSLLPPLTGGVWPTTAAWGDQGELVVGGVALTGLAGRYGTPAYVVDEADVRLRCRDHVAAFGPDAVAYSAKALLSKGIARWVAEEGLHLYVGSAGELGVAQAAGFPADRMVMYGNAKTPDDLQAAFAAGVGAVVAESAGEIPRLAASAPAGQRVLLRVLAGADFDQRAGSAVRAAVGLGRGGCRPRAHRGPASVGPGRHRLFGRPPTQPVQLVRTGGPPHS